MTKLLNCEKHKENLYSQCIYCIMEGEELCEEICKENVVQMGFDDYKRGVRNLYKEKFCNEEFKRYYRIGQQYAGLGYCYDLGPKSANCGL